MGTRHLRTAWLFTAIFCLLTAILVVFYVRLHTLTHTVHVLRMDTQDMFHQLKQQQDSEWVMTRRRTPDL